MALTHGELAKLAADNPDLPVGFIAKILEGLAESDARLVEPLDWSVP